MSGAPAGRRPGCGPPREEEFLTGAEKAAAFLNIHFKSS